jgi:predicted  nucleic acid-binding Zn-ribbon protein
VEDREALRASIEELTRRLALADVRREDAEAHVAQLRLELQACEAQRDRARELLLGTVTPSPN